MKITKTEVGVLIAIIALVLGLSWTVGMVSKDIEHQWGKFTEQQKKDDRSAYDAWVKMTENPKKLTYDEWKALSDKGLLPKEGPDG